MPSISSQCAPLCRAPSSCTRWNGLSFSSSAPFSALSEPDSGGGVQGIGDDPDVESTSSGTVQTEEGYQPVFFDPRPLKNLLPIDEMESLSPILDMKARP